VDLNALAPAPLSLSETKFSSRGAASSSVLRIQLTILLISPGKGESSGRGYGNRLHGFRIDRKQVFAEALARFRAGVAWRLSDEEKVLAERVARPQRGGHSWSVSEWLFRLDLSLASVSQDPANDPSRTCGRPAPTVATHLQPRHRYHRQSSRHLCSLPTLSSVYSFPFGI